MNVAERANVSSQQANAPICLATNLWFLFALLCKSSVVMFPFVLLLHAWWRRGRLRTADLAASAPFFALSLGLGLVTLRLESHQVEQLGTLHPGDRPSGAAGRRRAGRRVLLLQKRDPDRTASDLSTHGGSTPPSAAQFLPWFAIAAAGLLWLGARRALRAAWLGLGWFFINLVPVLGIAGMAFMRIAQISDHFAPISRCRG